MSVSRWKHLLFRTLGQSNPLFHYDSSKGEPEGSPALAHKAGLHVQGLEFDADKKDGRG
jgi:hypothetical protein